MHIMMNIKKKKKKIEMDKILLDWSTDLLIY